MTIEKAHLTWAELEKVLLDIEIILNNRPLTYIEKEIDYPMFTLSSLILGLDVNFSDAALRDSESMKKQQKYIEQCKKALWKR